MPNTKSAKKRLRQDLEQRERNRAVKSSVKTQIKKVISALRDGKIGVAETEFRAAASHLDRAAGKGVIHKNQAARRKSTMTKRLLTKRAETAKAPAAKKA